MIQPFVVNIDTKGAVSSLDELRVHIKKSFDDLDALDKANKKLARPKASRIQLANCALSIVIVALQLLNLYMVTRP